MTEGVQGYLYSYWYPYFAWANGDDVLPAPDYVDYLGQPQHPDPSWVVTFSEENPSVWAAGDPYYCATECMSMDPNTGMWTYDGVTELEEVKMDVDYDIGSSAG